MLAILLIFCIAFPMAMSAQFITPYNPSGGSRTWSLKGKALPFVLGDEGGASALFGAEYGFAKNQSLGIDAFIEANSKSDDNGVDTAGATHQVATYYHSRERALFLNYRYYFSSKKLREDRGITPYALVFLRYGKIDQHYTPLYPLTSFLDNYETHYSAGLMAGSIVQFSHSGRLGLDINSGIFIKKKDISTVYLHNHQKTTVKSHPLGPGFRLSVNLVYWFSVHGSKN